MTDTQLENPFASPHAAQVAAVESNGTFRVSRTGIVLVVAVACGVITMFVGAVISLAICVPAGWRFVPTERMPPKAAMFAMTATATGLVALVAGLFLGLAVGMTVVSSGTRARAVCLAAGTLAAAPIGFVLGFFAQVFVFGPGTARTPQEVLTFATLSAIVAGIVGIPYAALISRLMRRLLLPRSIPHTEESP